MSGADGGGGRHRSEDNVVFNQNCSFFDIGYVVL